ncbi:hypothetical protein [Uliginosibacterium aquaticum]|uniref:Uncharacterized protein n=1 Tax=Uliginosibacterium aquaticum TaxID=2731212 RepID=A0ABX2IPX8_9RHOO|nr:hypothetical protein [Uliginosibacterium aquaticum]NSL56190.1 hypothetical protein [Uliginosibacterium aquaticum]
MTTDATQIANYYCVSHIAAATIPCSLLNNILSRMYQGQPLTQHAMEYLQKQKLHSLHRLACGAITYEAYIAGLDSTDLNEHETAKALNQAREEELRARAAHYASRPIRQTTPKVDVETARKLRRQREREETALVLRAQNARQAEWKLQRERNRELAAANYQSLANTSGYNDPTPQELARYYHLEHIAAEASLTLLLQALFHGSPIADSEMNRLRTDGPEVLYRLASGQSTLESYTPVARAVEAEALIRIARAHDQALYSKYGISLKDDSLRPRMTQLLKQIEDGTRLSKNDWEWLGTLGKECITPLLRKAYHQLEAIFYETEYQRAKDPWNAVNACGHYRKSDEPGKALKLIDGISQDRLNQPKIQSAVLTTRGGALRDLYRPHEAIQAGERAHTLMPKDYRPCTLLGAVHMEQRNFENGHTWYEKARALGAPEPGIDSELRSIFQKLDASGREAMKRFLLAQNPVRYSWLNDVQKAATRKKIPHTG